MPSEKQIAANRLNSSKSTGPKSVEGKLAASQNATRHGILSTRLFLPDEDPQEFKLLMEELLDSHTPQGVLEMVLIEKIAITIWKQRRVIAAETAAITLRSQNRQILDVVNKDEESPEKINIIFVTNVTEDSIHNSEKATSTEKNDDCKERSELYEVAKTELSILPDKERASIERYHTTLDNQLYRAIKELRSLQDRRLGMIKSVVKVAPNELTP